MGGYTLFCLFVSLTSNSKQMRVLLEATSYPFCPCEREKPFLYLVLTLQLVSVAVHLKAQLTLKAERQKTFSLTVNTRE